MPFRKSNYKTTQIILWCLAIFVTAWIVLGLCAAAFSGWNDFIAMLAINIGLFALSRYLIAPVSYSNRKPFLYLPILYVVTIGIVFFGLLCVSVWLGAATWEHEGDWEISNLNEVISLLVLPAFLGWMSYLIDRAKIDWDNLLALEAEVLRSHFFPHFLKNTLSAFQILAIKKPNRAAKIAEPLMQIFRYYNDIHDQQTHPLGTEMEQLENLCKIYRIQRSKKLRLVIRCAKEAVYNIKVPAMLLMTLIENCCLYGIVDDPKRPLHLTLDLLPDGRLYMCLTNFRKQGRTTSEESTQLGLPLIKSLLKIYGEENRIDVIDDTKVFTVMVLWKDVELKMT
ncbi:hypothetical protein FAZ19_03850 [Sphingobacterium alkalisoli]|uniref:Signal transduction histidine kinase internal region domain-containing protein n=1 Tax=Sphingobacterium alkalisoli TaxID=1874115 RepID=A0A4V5LZ43_9SPHI|nr:histidine kinase [Sphingobacterium alkalisoli]TJY68399.1 hypothetical protein FAZ19_03850 [Sphingobacterium alkalisoli]